MSGASDINNSSDPEVFRTVLSDDVLLSLTGGRLDPRLQASCMTLACPVTGRLDMVPVVPAVTHADALDSPCTTAFDATRSGDLEGLVSLLKNGWKPNEEPLLRIGGVSKCSLFELALRNWHGPVASWLIDNGLDPLRQNSRGQSAVGLSYAFPNVLRHLIASGVPIEDVNPTNGDTVAHSVVRFGEPESWMALLETRNFTVLKAQNHQGESPLAMAMKSASAELRTMTLAFLAREDALRTLDEIDNTTSIGLARP